VGVEYFDCCRGLLVFLKFSHTSKNPLGLNGWRIVGEAQAPSIYASSCGHLSPGGIPCCWSQGSTHSHALSHKESQV
jgi:hypothetical protein